MKFCFICQKYMDVIYFNKHKHIIKYEISNIPNDISNIIYDYKYQLEVFDKYKKFHKFIIFFNDINSYETLSVNYNCNNKDIIYYLDDMIYIMKNTLSNFNYNVRQMITGKKLNKKNFNIEIFKFNIEYNTFCGKYFIRYL